MAQHTYKTRCAMCHGEKGDAKAPMAQTLRPRPRSFVDLAWQSTVTDEHIAKIVVENHGGTIAVTSSSSSGTELTLTIPQ